MGPWRAKGDYACDGCRKNLVGEFVKSKLKFVAIAAAALLLTGCSLAEKAGAAVVVGTERMSSSELVAEYQSVLDALPADSQGLGSPTQVNRTILQSYVYSVVVNAIGVEYGVVATDAQVAAERASLEEKYGKDGLLEVAAQGAIAPVAIDRTLRTSLTYRNVAEKLVPGGTTEEQDAAVGPKLIEFSKKLGVEIAPRYGQWNAETVVVEDLVDGLSVSQAAILAAAQG
jgi:hypothetical protein